MRVRKPCHCNEILYRSRQVFLSTPMPGFTTPVPFFIRSFNAGCGSLCQKLYPCSHGWGRTLEVATEELQVFSIPSQPRSGKCLVIISAGLFPSISRTLLKKVNLGFVSGPSVYLPPLSLTSPKAIPSVRAALARQSPLRTHTNQTLDLGAP